jgi:hypothetical protein
LKFLPKLCVPILSSTRRATCYIRWLFRNRSQLLKRCFRQV